jgi:hypothetical protein
VSRLDDNKNLELKRRKYRYGREIQRCPIVRIAWFYFVVYTIYLIHQITISLYLYPLAHSPARSIPFLSNQTSNSRRGRPHGTTNQGHAINPGTNISGKRQGQSFVRAIRSARPPTHTRTHPLYGAALQYQLAAAQPRRPWRHGDKYQEIRRMIYSVGSVTVGQKHKPIRQNDKTRKTNTSKAPLKWRNFKNIYRDLIGISSWKKNTENGKYSRVSNKGLTFF